MHAAEPLGGRVVVVVGGGRVVVVVVVGGAQDAVAGQMKVFGPATEYPGGTGPQSVSGV